MPMLATYLGHSKAELTYWYLESVPELMREIAKRFKAHMFVSAGQEPPLFAGEVAVLMRGGCGRTVPAGLGCL